MSYPVAYRSAAARDRRYGPGSQRSATPDRVPANDNEPPWRGPPPANDNSPSDRPYRPVPRGQPAEKPLPTGPRARPPWQKASASATARIAGLIRQASPAVRAVRAAENLYEWAQQAAGQQCNSGISFPGFRKNLDCGKPPGYDGPLHRNGAGSNNTCFVFQAGAGLALDAPYTSSERLFGFSLARHRPLGQWASFETYAPVGTVPATARPGVQLYPRTGPHGQRLPRKPLMTDPRFNPSARPIGRLQTQPSKIPWLARPYRLLPNPLASPTYWHQVGYGVTPAARPAQAGLMDDIIISSRGTVTRTSPRHRFKPPPKGTKEKKVQSANAKVLAVFKGVGKVFGAATEVSDFVDAFYETLPDHIRKAEKRKRHGKDPGLVDKIRLLYEHFDEVDAVQGWRNHLNDQQQDRLIGKMGEQLRSGYPDWLGNRPVGVQTGPAL